MHIIVPDTSRAPHLIYHLHIVSFDTQSNTEFTIIGPKQWNLDCIMTAACKSS